MINKKNVLGKEPDELGNKDAIHVAIVSVRAGNPLEPGTRCRLDEHNEAVPDPRGVGVADPFRKKVILRGERFWLLLAQDEVPNVRHEWEHPTIDFSPPTREIVRNETLLEDANTLGLTYEQLMNAIEYVVTNQTPAKYEGTKTPEELVKALENIEYYDMWGDWAGETLYQFENYGDECCPDYDYPDCGLFKVPITVTVGPSTELVGKYVARVDGISSMYTVGKDAEEAKKKFANQFRKQPYKFEFKEIGEK